ncbi:MAG: serpin family protein [Chitinivibrionales bacterium]|nr:serpin family protein [Chitinivibrionales bacterium]
MKHGWNSVRPRLLPLLVLLCLVLNTLASEKTVMTTQISNNNSFAFALFAKVATPTDNVFFSPYSISTAMAMVYAGASGNTRKQIGDAMHFLADSDSLNIAFKSLTAILATIQKKKQCTLLSANKLWIHAPLQVKPDFLTITKNYYSATAQKVDFKYYEKARGLINTWVEKQTKSKITQILAPGTLTDMTRLVLANAIYFKGQWLHKFDKTQTSVQPFHRSAADSVVVPFMHQKATVPFTATDSYSAAVLPYAGNDVSMVIIVPKAVDGLTSVEKTLTDSTLTAMLGTTQEQSIEIALPKFTITYAQVLNAPLQELGIADAFTRAADFSRITTKEGLFVSVVIHKAFIEVSEEGTEAAAATVVALRGYSAQDPQQIVADRPFIYLIRENSTGAILFLGRFVQPLSK